MLIDQLTRCVLGSAIVSAAVSPLASAQGDNGFLRGQGKADVVLSFTHDEYDDFWLGDDDVDAPGDGVTRRTTTLHAAFGLRDDLDVVVAASNVEASVEDDSFEEQDDPQDALLGAKWRFWTSAEAGRNDGLSLLFAPSVKLPLTDYENDDVTAIGDGQVDLRGRVIAHYQHESGIFAALETGYDRRNGAPTDEIPVNLSIGATYGPFTLSPFYSRVFSDGGPDIGGGSFPSVQEEYERVGATFYARLGTGFGLTGMWRTTTDGKNTGDVDTVSLGVVLRF